MSTTWLIVPATSLVPRPAVILAKNQPGDKASQQHDLHGNMTYMTYMNSIHGLDYHCMVSWAGLPIIDGFFLSCYFIFFLFLFFLFWGGGGETQSFRQWRALILTIYQVSIQL